MGPVPLRLLLMSALAAATWRCPEISRPLVSCACDLPHTLRCVVDGANIGVIARRLRNLPQSSAVSLLDMTAHNATSLPGAILAGVALHGLVISSGQLSIVSPKAFGGMTAPLQALGLPNNLFTEVPTEALQYLPELERLDLSHNMLVSLNASAFTGCGNLSFLDLSENRLSNLSSDVFAPLVALRTLRLRGNALTVFTLSHLTGLYSLLELDLSANSIIGPIGPTTLPPLQSLETLLLSENQISSVRMAMLRNATSLLTLSLSHNQIDVLEDHGFLELSTLRTLDLANNRIVAVSGASLAHLPLLTELDLAHNFLRVLTADLVLQLANLRELRLDDNDISTVASGALTLHTQLNRLTLADNPLNCDCTLVEFSTWLSNSSLPAADRRTAVCATPPSLENALLADISSGDLRCGEELDAAVIGSATVPLSSAQIILRAFQFDGTSVTLLWSVDSAAAPFACDALFVYEELDNHEILLSSIPLRCNSSQLADATALTVRLPVKEMQRGHRYRYCVVLLEQQRRNEDVQLVLGCSEVIPLDASPLNVAQAPRISVQPRIAAVSANVSDAAMFVSVTLWDAWRDPQCRITVTVLAAAALAAQHHVNCSTPRLVVSGLPPGPYHVCATLGVRLPNEPRVTCVPVSANGEKSSLNVTIIVGFAFAISALLALLCIVARWYRRPRIVTTHQCFMATGETEEQHPRYVKLQATTNL